MREPREGWRFAPVPSGTDQRVARMVATRQGRGTHKFFIFSFLQAYL